MYITIPHQYSHDKRAFRYSKMALSLGEIWWGRISPNVAIYTLKPNDSDHGCNSSILSSWARYCERYRSLFVNFYWTSTGIWFVCCHREEGWYQGDQCSNVPGNKRIYIWVTVSIPMFWVTSNSPRAAVQPKASDCVTCSSLTLNFWAVVYWRASIWMIYYFIFHCLFEIIHLILFFIDVAVAAVTLGLLAWTLSPQCGWKALEWCRIFHSLGLTAWSWSWVLNLVYTHQSCEVSCHHVGAIPPLSNLLWFNWCRLSLVHSLLGGGWSNHSLAQCFSGSYCNISSAFLQWGSRSHASSEMRLPTHFKDTPADRISEFVSVLHPDNC